MFIVLSVNKHKKLRQERNVNQGRNIPLLTELLILILL